MLIPIRCVCPFCGKAYMVECDYYHYSDYIAGEKLIQDCFPELTPAEREGLKTGICSECWDEMFKEV